MAQTIQDLYDFIERAVKSRKYPDNTAQGLKAALKLFDGALNDEERQSLDVFKKNFDQIYRSVAAKNGNTFSANSLAVYKSRVSKILNNYEAYGIDPTKMANWTPKILNRSPKKQKSSPLSNETSGVSESSGITIDMFKMELPLRPGIKSVIIVPPDMTSSECSRIKAILDSLVVKS